MGAQTQIDHRSDCKTALGGQTHRYLQSAMRLDVREAIELPVESVA
jgi:hypothetical protein